MEDELITILSELGYPIFLQGSLLPDEPYPDSFFTFWNNSTSSDSYYDNDEGAVIYDYSLNFYSNDPELVNSELVNAKELLKESGWVVSGVGYSVLSDENTHTGRGINILYRKSMEVEL